MSKLPPAPSLIARPLSRFEAAALGVDPQAERGSAGLKGRGPAGEIDAPAFQVSGVFNYQSYFDDTLLQNAILAQPSNSPIVPSTLADASQVSGYAIGLHPSSETPVAVIMQTGAQQGATQAFRLKPGDVIRPHGSVKGRAGSFSGFTWGLPFGWLGGGSAMLVVMRTPDAKVFWTGNPEIIFHRQRMQIQAAPGPATAPLNWPKRFPWPGAVFGANNIQQAGKAALGVSPTRTAMSLRLASLANPASMRVGFVATNDYAWDANGAPTAQTDVRFVDVTWGSYAATATQPGAYYPSQMFTGEMERYAADAGGVVLVDITGTLSGGPEPVFVDVVRYGHL